MDLPRNLHFDLPKAIAISIVIHIILMIGLPEFNKPILKPLELSITISSSSIEKPIDEPIEKNENPQPIKKIEPKYKKIIPIVDKNEASVSQPVPKEDIPPVAAEAVLDKPRTLPQEQLTENFTQYLDGYSSLLSNAISKYKQYPKIAQMRGWQGLVIADIEIDKKGSVISIKIKKSSTYEVLDNEALEMIKKASPFPAPPEGLRGKNFNVLVPISFKLE